MFYVITGGAGFIGSNLAAALEERNDGQVVICDRLRNAGKWRNIAKRCLWDIVPPEQFFQFMERNQTNIKIVFHLGAISTTTETDADLILRNNFALSRDLLEWSIINNKRLIYASSAATYGNGDQEFLDHADERYLACLRPLNPYGWSKHLFDRHIARRKSIGLQQPPQLAGLKFFNVFGPNEYHKGGQQSVVSHIYRHFAEGDVQKLFRSDNPAYHDGEQLRDFIYIDDCISVMLWLLDNPQVSGLFNVGTGVARSFLDLNAAVYAALGVEPVVEFIDMPTNMRGRYQYYTKADPAKLRLAGFGTPFTTLEDGIRQYVRDFLVKSDPYR